MSGSVQSGQSAKSRPSRKEQAARHAEAAREKVEARRESASGAAGWVADRAGEWSLDGPDMGLMEVQKYFWNPLTAHDALMAAPLIGRYFRRMGVLPAAPDSIAAALAAGRDVALWPGGEVDSLRPWTERDTAILAGRTGFVRMAIHSGVPIVPVATIGGPDSMPVLFRGRRLAKTLQLDRIARLKVFPFALSAPWGIAPAAIPEIPLPTKIRTAFQEPVEVDRDPARAEDRAYVASKYEEVRQSIQRGMKALARRRAFPIFG